MRPAAEVLLGHLRREGCRHRLLPAQHADRHLAGISPGGISRKSSLMSEVL